MGCNQLCPSGFVNPEYAELCHGPVEVVANEGEIVVSGPICRVALANYLRNHPDSRILSNGQVVSEQDKIDIIERQLKLVQ
jgi:hypothetical protein